MIVPLGRPDAVAVNGVALSIRPAHMDDVEPMLALQAQAFNDKFTAAFGRKGAERDMAALIRTHRLGGATTLQGMHVALLGERIVGTITMRTTDMCVDDGTAMEQAFLRELGTWGTMRAMHALSQLDHRIGRDEGYLTDVAVVEDLRRCGIAQAMLRYTMQLARVAGKRRLGLYVSASNHKAIALYEQLEFEKQRVQRSWWSAFLLGERRWIYMVYAV